MIYDRLDLFRELIPLVQISSPSGKEHEMQKYCSQRLCDLGFLVRSDKMWNLRATRKYDDKKVPLLTAHMDTVARFVEGNDEWRSTLTQDMLLHAITPTGDHEDCWYYPDHYCGFDDKLGIALIFALARKNPQLSLKIALTTQEEIGEHGAEFLMVNYPDFFQDVKFALTLDRMHGNEIINKYRGNILCDANFQTFLEKMLPFGFKFMESPYIADTLLFAYGDKMADQSPKNRKMNCVNFSTGYYTPNGGLHEKNDYFIIRDALNVVETIDRILAEPFQTEKNLIPTSLSRII